MTSPLGGSDLISYEQLESRIATWAATQPDIRAVIAVGSRARGEADRWSDLDLLMFTSERERYLDPGWLRAFGEVWLTYLDEAGPNDPEWFAIFDGGLKLDIVLLKVENNSPGLEQLLQGYPYQTVFARGVTVLFDRHGPARSLPPKAIELPVAPSASTFDNVVSSFLLESVTTARFIARGDLWRAHWWFANDLRPKLLKLMEWHSNGRDSWYNGRFINSWADPRALAALPETFALYERESLHNALRTMLQLFRLLGEETAVRFSFTYPVETHRKIATLIDDVLTDS